MEAPKLSGDAPDAMFYIDPPYVGADQGHYSGYTQKDFDNLLESLTKVRGKFLLSSYPNNRLNDYVRKYKWFQIELVMNNTPSSSQHGFRVEKTEVLTANYPIYIDGIQSPSLFG